MRERPTEQLIMEAGIYKKVQKENIKKLKIYLAKKAK